MTGNTRNSRQSQIKHHAALPWTEVVAFVECLRASPDLAARALELLILTAVRTQEATAAQWSEIDYLAADVGLRICTPASASCDSASPSKTGRAK